MLCPKCGGNQALERSLEDRGRAFKFLGVAIVIAIAGGVLQLLSIPNWPWMAFFTSAFVFTQALAKWINYAFAWCPRCHFRTTIWPWSK